MTLAWSNWVHVMWSTRGAWLPGDRRGFRDHDHRIHSSGDYRNPPPANEHVGLRLYAQRITKNVVRLSADQRQEAGSVILKKFHDQKIAVRAIAIAPMHVHVLIRTETANARGPVGVAKQVASRALNHRLPGRIWGQRCHIVRVRDQSHYRNVRRYILDHQSEGAWTWEPERLARMDIKP